MGEVENEDPEQMATLQPEPQATLQPEQQVEEQRAEITVDEFTDDIEQAGTSRIPSCDIITLDDTTDSNIHDQAMMESSDDDDIVITSMTPAVSNPNDPIDLTNATIIAPPQSPPRINDMGPSRLIRSPPRTLQRPVMPGVDPRLHRRYNLDVYERILGSLRGYASSSFFMSSGLLSGQRNLPSVDETSARVISPFETQTTTTTSTSTTVGNNTVVDLLDSEDEDGLAHNVNIPTLAPLRKPISQAPPIKKRRSEEPSSSSAPQQPPPATAAPQSDITCPICMDDKNEILVANKTLMASPCGHILCSECHKQSMRTMGTGQQKILSCVTCRKKVKGNAFIKLFF